MIPERTNNHHSTYDVAQASQAKHGSLVDRGANGGLAGSDVRILSRSSRKCTVTAIDSHELYTLQGPMNGILKSWSIPTHLVMGSLLGPMTLMRDLPLTLILMNLGITPKGQYKLSVFWMTHHPL